MRTSDALTRSRRAILLATMVVVVGGLYFARDVLIPFALAMLLSFLLAPPVIRLQRWGLPRLPAVLVVTLLAFSVIGLIGWLVAGQINDLASQLPQYRYKIAAKIETVRTPVGGALGKASETVKALGEEINATQPAVRDPAPVQKVQIVEPPLSTTQLLRTTLAPLLDPLATAGIVVVLVIFMLLQREDLRDRLIRLIGSGQVGATTSALNDAAQRVSRYLLMQTTINGTYGLAVGIGLSAMGLRGAALWGLLCGLLRFIPYLGTWLGAAMPVVLSLAIFDTWTRPLMIIGYFILLETLAYAVMEPWLYGLSTGVSPMAVLVAAIFWTWLWGGVGLFLATPLTVCLVVLGKFVPQLGFLNVLLGDQPVLEPKDRVYQRLLALDQEDALELLEKSLRDSSLEEVYDTVLIPALALAEADRHRGDLDEHKEAFILQSMREIIDELGEHSLSAASADVSKPAAQTPADSTYARLRVLCLPARDEADELVGLMLAQLLTADGFSARPVSTGLAGELVNRTEQEQAHVVCISALPPGALTPARYLCKRLRARLPEVRIAVGLWGAALDVRTAAERLRCDGTVEVVTTLAAARKHIRQLVQPIVLHVQGTEREAARA